MEKDDIFEDDFSLPDSDNSTDDLEDAENDNADEDEFSDEETNEETEHKTEIIRLEEYLPVPAQKKKNIGGTLKWLIPLLLIFCTMSFFLSESEYIKNYRTNFVMNVKMIDEKLGISRTFDEFFGDNYKNDELKRKSENKAMGTKYDNESYLVPFEHAGNAAYYSTDKGILISKSNYIALFNNKGKAVWEMATSVVNPILCVEGDYIAVAEAGGTKICLYEGNTLVYASDAENNILNANVSSEGDVVVVTEKEFYKGAIEVFNKSGERIYSWASGSETIICADISPGKRRVAAGFLDATGRTKSSIQFFNVKETESYKKVVIPDTVVFKTEFTGETLNVFGDNRVIGLSTDGGIEWDETYTDDAISAAEMDERGNKAVLSVSDNVPVIQMFSRGGGEKSNFAVDEIPDHVDISGDRILYNNTRMILYGKTKNPKKYAATMDIKDLKIIDRETILIVYSNSIEFVKM